MNFKFAKLLQHHKHYERLLWDNLVQELQRNSFKETIVRRYQFAIECNNSILERRQDIWVCDDKKVLHSALHTLRKEIEDAYPELEELKNTSSHL